MPLNPSIALSPSRTSGGPSRTAIQRRHFTSENGAASFMIVLLAPDPNLPGWTEASITPDRLFIHPVDVCTLRGACLPTNHTTLAKLSYTMWPAFSEKRV
ncbi:unnamed protein product [Protopolystoma xenopodis]|uniref:Uncharacterized protein n=1 Tax=Protopolystoma xenopodis TaxID=117903 RepID=A0A3S5BTI5_9PLAT|nr:unnamed protein product [Protopolystoma xenopodis]